MPAVKLYQEQGESRMRGRFPLFLVLAAVTGCTPSLSDCMARNDLAGHVVRSAAERPNDWSSNGAYWRHVDGLSFWIGSDARFMRPVADADSDNWPTRLGIFATEAQDCAYAAYKRWRENRQYEPSLTRGPAHD